MFIPSSLQHAAVTDNNWRLPLTVGGPIDFIAPPTEERLNVLAPYVTSKAPFDEPQILRVLYPLLPSKTSASLDVCAGQK
jgi:hypothetical protein